jgi:polyribonucleotide nucleotidyltransferase
MRLKKEVSLGDSLVTLESGHIAKQADGSCTVRVGDTVVLTTACMAKSGAPRDFLPLTVDYRENTYAGGRIPGGFFKREGRPTEKEIITCRMIDRPMRPLFPTGYFNETQIISFVLSADGENDPDIMAINGASTALSLSSIPFYESLGAIRVGVIDGNVVYNPTRSQRDSSELDLIVVGSESAIVMVEAAANQLPEELILDCIFAGHQEVQKIITAQKEMQQEAGIVKPQWQAPSPYPAEVYEHVNSAIGGALKNALHTVGKFERSSAVSAVTEPYLEQEASEDDTKRGHIKKVIKVLEEEFLRETILKDKKRFDGRELNTIRKIDTEVGFLPRTHGSALFTRGETQALATATLGTRRDAQIIEEYDGETKQKFLLHYNFPPFSVGEVRFLRGPGRREIGHGVLARRALVPVLPDAEDFPYTVRVVSDILESNGSSSMATVCGGSLALFDAGVPLLAPVAGVAMGLIKNGDDFAVLSDIAGQEDHYGDMDFKVAGTSNGITALQMDIKIAGVTREIMDVALQQAREGRMHILGLMSQTIDSPRSDISTYAPRLHTLHIPVAKIRDVIGPGGKTIRSIIEETGCEVEVESDGKVTIASPDGVAANRAIEIIEKLTESAEVGKTYTGTVRRVEAYGAFVEILPGTDGLVHISELAPYRVKEVSDIVSEGDELEVKVINIDEQNKVRLSRKAVIVEAPDYDPAKYEGMGYDGPAPERKESPRGRGRNDRNRGGRGPRR